MIDLKETNKHDPLKRFVKKDAGLEHVEHSPMDPPDAYDKNYTLPEVEYEKMPAVIKKFVDEHKVAITHIDNFEKALAQFKEKKYQFNKEINDGFSQFFNFFDNNIMAHNHKEEKILFPLLNEKLMASGEHSKEPNPKTPIDIMEDDHVKFIQLGTLSLNLLGLAPRLHDEKSRMYVYDIAYNNAKELVEMLRLHIFREDHTLFPLAHKLINEQEFTQMAAEMAKY